MEIIKTGHLVSEEHLLELEEKLTDIIECPICKTLYKPDVSDLSFTTKLNSTSNNNLIFTLSAGVDCPICGIRHTQELEGLTEAECIMMRRRK